MATDFETVRKQAENYASDVSGVFPVDKVVLFGSYAKGTADEQSDIGVCFFLSNFGNKRRIDIIKELLGLMRKYSFEPTVFPTSEIQKLEKMNRSLNNYIDLDKLTIPVVIFKGDEFDLATIFENMNTGGTKLSKYEIFAAKWQDILFCIEDRALLKCVDDKYNKLPVIVVEGGSADVVFQLIATYTLHFKPGIAARGQ